MTRACSELFEKAGPQRLCGALQSLTVWRQKMCWWHGDHSKDERTRLWGLGWMDHIRWSLRQRTRGTWGNCMKDFLCKKIVVWQQWHYDIDCVTCHHVSRHPCMFCQLDSEQVQRTHVRAFQDKMLRRMIYVLRRSTETTEAHMISWWKLMHNCRGKYKRLTKSDPQRKASRIFMKNLWNLNKVLGCREWRWEQVVAQCLGTDWTNVTQDRMGWKNKMHAMIKCRKHKMTDGNTSHRVTIDPSAVCFSQIVVWYLSPYEYMVSA